MINTPNIMTNAKSESSKYTNPDEKLVAWLQKRLKLEDEIRDMNEEKDAGKTIVNSIYSRKKESNARKSDILDQIIFPSMANLIYFFETLEKNSEVKKSFEKPLIDLLNPQFTAEHVRKGEIGMPGSTLHMFRNNNLKRLVSNMISIDYEKNDEILRDFRIALLYQLQLITYDAVKEIFKKEYGVFGQITKSVKEDFEKTIGWLALIAKSGSNELKGQNREMGFSNLFQ